MHINEVKVIQTQGLRMDVIYFELNVLDRVWKFRILSWTG